MKEHNDIKHNNNKTNFIDGKSSYKSNLTNRSVEFVVKRAQEPEDSLQRPHTGKYSSYISWARSRVCVRDILNNPLWIYLSRQREICWRSPTFSDYFGHGAPERLGEKNSKEVEEDGHEDELGAGGEEVEESWGQNFFHCHFLIGELFIRTLGHHFLLRLFNGAFRIFRLGVII